MAVISSQIANSATPICFNKENKQPYKKTHEYSVPDFPQVLHPPHQLSPDPGMKQQC